MLSFDLQIDKKIPVNVEKFIFKVFFTQAIVQYIYLPLSAMAIKKNSYRNYTSN
jgi:hypothetical protein